MINDKVRRIEEFRNGNGLDWSGIQWFSVEPFELDSVSTNWSYFDKSL